MRRYAALLAAGVLIVAAVWAGHAAREARLAGRAPPPLPLAPAPAAEPWDPGFPPARNIPEHLPAFTLADLDGRATAIAAWEGKSLIINFWATWCAPCRREMPLLQGLARDWSGRNFTVVGIAVDHREQVQAYARAMQISYPLLVGDQDALDVATALGVTTAAFPFTVFTDRHGLIVALYMGELHAPQTDLILGVVEEVNRGHLSLAAARERITEGLAKQRKDATV